MRRTVWGLLLWLASAAFAAQSPAQAPAGSPAQSATPSPARAPVVVLTVDGAIGPAVADYFHRGMERAAKEGAQLVVLRIDTPGGLDLAMRDIIKDILGAPMPVATFVSPGGARAASAGTYILYASHIAAMAPGTSVGAATPVRLGGGAADPAPARREGARDRQDDKAGEAGSDTMARKTMEDAVAYIKALATLRNRNADWAERAVRQAASLHAEEALSLKVIDLVAVDVPSLLARVDGRTVVAAGRTVSLSTAGVTPIAIEPDARNRFLALITDPSIAYILMLIGVYALLFEFMSPGAVLPGVAGAICLLLAAYALHVLPVSYAGLALLVVGIAFMIAEVFVPAYGSLGIGGVIAFVIGSTMLIDSDVPGYQVPLALILGFAVASLAFFLVIIGFVYRARRRPVVSGREGLIGTTGEVIEDLETEGWARVRGESWRVKSARPLKAGSRVRVTGMAGLVLDVVPETEAGS